MQVGSVEAALVGGVVGLVEGEVRKVAVEVLHVGDVAGEAYDGGVGEGTETLDVGETSERAVGRCRFEIELVL